MSLSNTAAKRVALRAHPEGNLKVSDFSIEDCPIPAQPVGNFFVRNVFGPVDPTLRVIIDNQLLASKSMPSPPHAGSSNHPTRTSSSATASRAGLAAGTMRSLTGRGSGCAAPRPVIHVENGLEFLPQAQVDLFEKSTAGKVVAGVAAEPA